MSASTAQQAGPAATSLRAVAARFVELCNQGKNFEVMRTMYSPDIVSIEDDGSETRGQGPVIKKSEDFGVLNTINSQAIRGPFFNGESQFAIHFVHQTTPAAGGPRVTREEVAVYTVRDGLINREQFYIASPR
jgi:hypothetical protein